MTPTDHHDPPPDHTGAPHGHAHGNAHDRGLKAIARYIRIAPWMWKSDVNDAVVALIAPQRGETVIDIGAGMGPATVQAAARGASVFAVEPTPFMRNVMTARKFLSKSRKAITIVDGAAEALPFADHEADAVWSVNTMHHWTSPEDGTAEIARVLAPGGRVVLVDENFADQRHPDSEQWHERHADDDHHGFSMVDAAAFGELMTQVGLVDVVAEERDMGGVPVIAITGRAPTT